MLTKGDEYPIHQTPEPVAYSGTDRNFYDRYFFNGYGPAGEDQFGVAFGVYPHLNLADAHLSVLRDGVQHCVAASRHLDMERMDLHAGPISIEIVQPLQELVVRVAPHDGFAAELRFSGRAFPIEEPRFIHRHGPRAFMDYTRLTQNGRYRGWIEIDGDRRAVDGFLGTRDRSWGVRPIGAPDPQPRVPAVDPQFFWLWAPLHFADRSVFFHVNADAHGRPWNTRAVLCPDGAAQGEAVEVADAQAELDLRPGTRWAQRATLRIAPPGEPDITVAFEPLHHFQMRGIGYFDPDWYHGSHHGELEVARRTVPAAEPANPVDLHIQAFCRVTLTQDGAPGEQGIGVLEQMLLGRYEPLGLAGGATVGDW